MTSMKRTPATRKAWLGATALAVVAMGMWSSMTPAVAAAVVDQDDYTNDGQPFTSQDLSLEYLSSGRLAAQTFTAGITGALTEVTLAIQKLGTGAGATASIYKTSGGFPDCAVATAVIDPSTVAPLVLADNISLVSFSIMFNTPAQVQAGTQYAIVVAADRSSRGNNLLWGMVNNGPYSGGTALAKTSGAWGPTFPVLADRAFQTEVDSSLTGVSVCDSAVGGGSVIVNDTMWHQSYGRINAEQECAAGYTGSWAQWANDNGGGYVCNRAIYSYRPTDDISSLLASRRSPDSKSDNRYDG